ncbi:atp3 gamma subunit of the F1 sector of mitochondrial F1F0 ATP synthase [Hanseniaspora osmophila]
MYRTTFNTCLKQQRTYATLREIENRLKSIKNIEKITKTMKIVASTRLTKAEKSKVSTNEYVKAEKKFFETIEADKTDLTGAASAEESAATGKPVSLIVAITSDKGLCGSIHSQLAKTIRNKLNAMDQETLANTELVTIGDKIKVQLTRMFPDNIKLGFNGVGKAAPTFEESSLITSEILKYVNEESGSNKKYGKIEIYFNNPVTSISFEPTEAPVYSGDSIIAAPGYSKFEIDNDLGVPRDLFEFSLTNKILSAMANGYAAEVSARRNAMDNASKNAGDMINKYSILYNRTRQAVITNELVDIITGASSLD